MRDGTDYEIGTPLPASGSGGQTPEPLFLDETDAPLKTMAPVTGPTALDLFPNEETPRTPAPAMPPGTRTRAAAGSARTMPILALFVIAALLAFGAVRACQISADVAAAGTSSVSDR